jgi:dihydroorotase
MPELLQQVRVVDSISQTDKVADVLLGESGNYRIITSIADSVTELPPDTQVRDCRGLVLGNGLVDLYSHSGEPGFEERETLVSLMQSAKAGGFTRVCLLPDTSPAIDNSASVSQIHQKIREIRRNLPNIYLWAALTQGVEGQQITEFGELAETGIIGFADGKPLTNLGMVRRILEYLQPIKKPLAFWCCDKHLHGNGMMREGSNAVKFGLPLIPYSCETSAISALLELVATMGTPVHIMRVSTARGVELIADAKSRGLPVTASTTWMHLLLDSQAVKSYHPSLHLEPPLGNKSDLEALRRGIKGGIIDAIAIEHTPFTYEEKTVAFADAPPGAIGYELALPLLWQNLVETGEFTALELWQALSSRPASCLQQRLGSIVPGKPAELVLFNPHQVWKVESRNLHTLAANSYWYGQELTGKVIETWC